MVKVIIIERLLEISSWKSCKMMMTMTTTGMKLPKIMEAHLIMTPDQVHLTMIVSIKHHRGRMNNPVPTAHLVGDLKPQRGREEEENIMPVCRNYLRRNVRGVLLVIRQVDLEAVWKHALVGRKRNGARLRWR